MHITPVTPGTQWRKVEASRPGRQVRNRVRTVEVLSVDPPTIVSRYARVRDPDTGRVSHLLCSRMSTEWHQVHPA